MKRLVTLGVGYGLGLATSVYVRKRLRRAADRVAPERLRAEAAARGSDLAAQARATVERAKERVSDLRDAAAEGMDTMRQANSELQAEFGAGSEAQQGTPDGDDPEIRSPGGLRPRS